MKKYSKLILKILASGTLLTIIFLRIDKEQLITNLRLLDFRFVPLIILFIILNYVVGAFRWKAFLIFKNTDHISVKYLTNLYFIGSFFNNFMPTSIGGDVFKFLKLGTKINSKTKAFISTFMERFTGVFVLILISLLSLTKVLGFTVILVLAWFFLGFYISLKVLKFLGAKFEKLNRIYESLWTYRNEPKVIGWGLITSLIVQILAIFTQYFVFLAIGVKLPIIYSFLVIPIITLAGFFIPSVNGIGVQDALYMNFFGLVGVPQEVSLSASILYHLFRLAVSLIGGVLYALGKDD